MLTLAYPWLFVLLPLPWLVRAIAPPQLMASVAVRVPFGDRIRASMPGSLNSVTGNPKIFSGLKIIVIWCLVLISLTRPQWLEPPRSKTLPARDLLLLVDLSGSMRQEDFTAATGERVDRLTAVKQVLGEFLVRRDGDRVGLVVFGDAAYLQAPFSDDLELTRQLLNETEIGMAGPRTAFGDAIGLGISLYDDSQATAKTIIALTDGNDTASQLPPTEASRVALQRGIRIHAVAIGDPTTVGEEKLDEATLQEVANCAGGTYFYAADRAELAGIYAELDQIETRQVETISQRSRRELYWWPLLAALIVWMLDKLLAARSARRISIPNLNPPVIHVHPVTGELSVH